MTTERPPVHAADWRTSDPVVTLRDHERRTLEQIHGIESKIARLQQALVFRRAALTRVRANLAEAVLAQRGTAQHET